MDGCSGVQSNVVHFSCRSYLIIVLTEVKDNVVTRAICRCESVECGFPCNTFNVVNADRGNKSSTVNSCRTYLHDFRTMRLYQRIFIHQFNSCFIVKSQFTQLHLLKFLCKFYHFLEDIEKNQKGLFL